MTSAGKDQSRRLQGRYGSRSIEMMLPDPPLKLRGAGEWLFEKDGTTKRCAWRKLHIGIDAGNGEIVAFEDKDVDNTCHVPRYWIN